MCELWVCFHRGGAWIQGLIYVRANRSLYSVFLSPRVFYYFP